MMNVILRDLIDYGVVVYIDDILIYTGNEEEYVQLTREVLRRLQENNLAIGPDKCEWHQKQVEFLGYLISGEGVSMSEDKIDTIPKWQIPESVKDDQSFLGFANFYWRFIQGFSKICYSLTQAILQSALFFPKSLMDDCTLLLTTLQRWAKPRSTTKSMSMKCLQ
jgi:hypothetical protein